MLYENQPHLLTINILLVVLFDQVTIAHMKTNLQKRGKSPILFLTFIPVCTNAFMYVDTCIATISKLLSRFSPSATWVPEIHLGQACAKPLNAEPSHNPKSSFQVFVSTAFFTFKLVFITLNHFLLEISLGTSSSLHRSSRVIYLCPRQN